MCLFLLSGVVQAEKEERITSVDQEIMKLLLHSNIQMTERYAHLAPDHLHDAVANLGFSTQFQHTEKPRRQCSTRMT